MSVTGPEDPIPSDLASASHERLVAEGAATLDGLVAPQHRRAAAERVVEAVSLGIAFEHTTVAPQFQGQLPPPQILSAYETILPGLPDRLMTMAEAAQRAEIETVKDVNRRTDRYQLMALGSGLLGLVLILTTAYALAVQGKEWVAGAVLGIGVAGVIGTLVNAPATKKRGGTRPDEATVPPPD